MTATTFTARRILVIGETLSQAAVTAFPEARIEVIAAGQMPDRWTFGDEPELVVIAAAAAPAEQIAALIAAMARNSSPPAAILAGADIPVSLVRALLKLPRADVVEAPYRAEDLAEAAAPLLRPLDLPAPVPTGGRCWTVASAVGGAGATTLAIEMAAALVERAAGKKRVALVDLNLADGAAAAYLGAAANMMLGRASAAPDRIDAALLEVFASPAAGGIDLIAQARDPHGFESVSPEAVVRVLETACQVYDFVIVDAPRHRRAWTLDVFAGSDALLIVSELTVPALLAARAMAAELEADLPDGPAPRIILNRLAKRVFGPAPSMGEAEKALGRKADAGLTSDWEAAAASVNLGGPIRSHRPRSRIARDVDALVDRLLATALPLPGSAPLTLQTRAA
jgi:pilus assembly protein CpaE